MNITLKLYTIPVFPGEAFRLGVKDADSDRYTAYESPSFVSDDQQARAYNLQQLLRLFEKELITHLRKQENSQPSSPLQPQENP